MASVSQAGTVAVNIVGDDAGFHKTLQKVDNALTSSSAKLQKFVIGLAAVRTAFSGISAPVTNTLSVFSNFEYGMSKVQAITVSTAAEIGKLREQAKELGKTTFFTASQVADAQKFLGMAGFRPDQILAATPKVLDLALAGDMDLGQAADIATNISTPFKIAAKDLGRVNDVLAKSAVTSNTNVQELGQAFKYAAPAAAAAGQSIEECGAAMSILANNGIKADMAGTSIRMMLIKLADSDIQEKLTGYGVAAADAAGNMRPLMDILRDLKKATSNMTQTEQMSAFYDIFEQRAGTSALVLGNCGEAADDFRAKMNDSFGTASQMAKTMADNMKGDWIAFVSALEGVQIAYGSSINGASRTTLQNLTLLTRAVADFTNAHPYLIRNVSVLAGTLTAVLAASKGFTAVMGLFPPMFKSAAVSAASETASITSETAAVNANTQAVNANVAAKRAQVIADAAKAKTSIGTALSGVTGNIASLTSQKGAFTAELGAISAQRLAWEKELQAANISALRGSAAAQKEVAVIQNEINVLKTREVALNGQITAASNQIAAAEGRRAALTRAAGNVQAAMTTQLNALELQRVALLNSSTAATARLSVSQRTSAAAMAVVNGATRTVMVSMAALKASMAAHPFMWIAGAVAGLGTLVHYLTVAREKSAELSDVSAKERDKGDTERTADEVKMRRLQQLSEKQQLSNKEQQEAARLSQELQGKYGDFGASVDGVSGSLSLAGDAMERFMNAMNGNAMNQLQNEIKESENNIGELRKQADNTGWYFRQLFANFGMADTGAAVQEKIGNKILAEREKINAARKRLLAMQNGETAVDAAKDPTALLEEKMGKAETKEYDKALKEVEKISEERARSRKSALENEIGDLQKRNEEYKKYLQLLLKTEKDPKKKEWYEGELKNSDKNLSEDLKILAEKNKLLSPKTVEAPALLDKQTALLDAQKDGDVNKIKAAKDELQQAKDELAQTSLSNLQNAYNTAKKEYADAKAAFDNAKTQPEKMLAGSKLNDAAKELEDAGKNYESAVERQITDNEKDKEKKIKDGVEKTKELADTNAGAGTFSAFDDYENMGTTIGDSLQKQLTQQAKSNVLLSLISNGISEMNEESGRFS